MLDHKFLQTVDALSVSNGDETYSLIRPLAAESDNPPLVTTEKKRI